jgi:hypothetical protein
MNGDMLHASFGGHVGRSVVGDNDPPGAFYKPEGGYERGEKGMRSTTMVDLQCVDFRVEGELGAEMTEGKGEDGACVSE